MTQSKMYKRHRFRAEIIQYAVWLHHRFNLSHRDVEDLLAERGVTVSYEAIRLWCNKFGPKYAQRLRRKLQGCGDTFYRRKTLRRALRLKPISMRFADDRG
jgi:putative transposase